MLELDLSDFPVLRTERLVLRSVEARDAEALHAMRTSPGTMAFIPRAVPANIGETLQLIATMAKDRAENNGITWAITLKDNDSLIGTIGYYRLKKEHFRGEVGYMLSAEQRGRGIMGEALEAAVQCGFQRFGFHSIEAVTDPRNTASNRLLERHGFVQEGLFKEDCYWNGEFLDSAVWSRLKPR
jgi:[ribosomal protein S5]-alanine N-acetyltransferase